MSMSTNTGPAINDLLAGLTSRFPEDFPITAIGVAEHRARGKDASSPAQLEEPCSCEVVDLCVKCDTADLTCAACDVPNDPCSSCDMGDVTCTKDDIVCITCDLADT